MRSPEERPQQIEEILEAIAISLGNLQLNYEQIETRLEASTAMGEQLIEQIERAFAQYQHYYDLFQFAPDASLVIDSNGLILEANEAAAQLLKVPQIYLIRKPLAVFVPLEERPTFRAFLNQLSQAQEDREWEIPLCPKNGEPFTTEWKVAIAGDSSGAIAALRISLQNITPYKQTLAKPLPAIALQDLLPVEPAATPTLPQSLDGLQVLIVDDEADAREFLAAVLESHGIGVTAVASAAEALEVLKEFRPDVLMSDIRMPDENGYSLIRKIREREAETGYHIPAAAITAYQAEDREQALTAGFESHLHKLADPTEFVETIARLAGRI